MKKIYSSRNLLASFVFCLTPILMNGQTSKKITDQWIDKDEDENYTPRHECSFVQAGDNFILFGGRESAQTLELYNFKNKTHC